MLAYRDTQVTLPKILKNWQLLWVILVQNGPSKQILVLARYNIFQIVSSMQNRFTMSRQPPHIPNFESKPTGQQYLQTTREEIATSILLALTESQESQKMRQDNNGSEISCWNQNYLNVLAKKDAQQNKKPKMFRIRPEKNVLREKSFLVDETIQFKVGSSIHQELNKLRLPLKEKTHNSNQFQSFDLDKERSKTRNEVILEIKNVKNQIVPVIGTIRKLASQCACSNIVKERAESRHYQKIKRKQLYTCQNGNEREVQDSGSNMNWRERHKSLTIKNQPSQIINMRGQSIKRLFYQ